MPGWIRAAPGRLWRTLPTGQMLPDAEWAARHRMLTRILWAHVVGLPVFLYVQGFDVWGSIARMLPLVFAGCIARIDDLGRRTRSLAVVFGLLTACTVLVYGWHGQIEADFHFFVMIALLALYEDWLPFGVAVAYVTVEHGVLGAISPYAVYNPGGSPWAWAGIHGAFVLAASAAAVVTWRLNENIRVRSVEAEQHAQAAAERFRAAFDGGIFGMSITAPDGRFLGVNRAMCEIVGYGQEELLSCRFEDLTHPDDRAGDARRLRALLAGETEVYESEKRYIRRDGSVAWVHVGMRGVRGPSGDIEYFISQVSDVSSRKRFEEELAHRALHDAWTGLPNRVLLLDRLNRALARLRRRGGQLAVLFVDLDRFKLVNDAMGHSAGDEVLLEAADRLRRAVRQEDTVARFGGDEFVVICENADAEEASGVAERALEALAEPFRLENREFQLSASVGIRINEAPDVSAEVLLHDADVALYSAKLRGRGRFEVFDGRTETRMLDPLAAEQGLRLAIARGELRLHYQPELDLATAELIAVEALVRWEHPELGLIPPVAFIPLAEESELIIELGQWVLREACAELAGWRASGLASDGLRVAVNVSPRQLADPALPTRVTAALSDAGLPASALCLEITESALVDESGVALTNLEAIKRLGVSIELDDFGVGFSSLSRIRELPAIDAIKIDRSFTAGLLGSASDGAVIAAVVRLAASLSVPVIAEGIETLEQLDALCKLGCDAGQGFLLAPPQPADEVAQLLTKGIAALVPPRVLASATARF